MKPSLLSTCLATPILVCRLASAAPVQADAACAPQLSTAEVLGLQAAGDSSAGITFPVFDQPGDGALWVMGENFKARFDSHGLAFIPFLGSDAPQDYPLELQLESVAFGARSIGFDAEAAPELEGDRVVYHRGAVDEIYVVGARSIEQVFELRDVTVRDELTIRVRSHSELESRGGAEGLRYSNDRGGVAYGRATTMDALDRRLPTATRLAEGAIEIRVPATALAESAFPRTIDPTIFTFSVVDQATNNPELPDTSYDLTTNTWLCVYQQTFSAADHDVVARRFDGSGALLSTSFIDGTSNDWTGPRVANNNAQDQFMVVGQVSLNTVIPRISARTCAAATGFMGAQFDITPASTPGLEHYSSPDIGGDDYPNGAPAYCVVYMETGTPSSSGGNGVWCSRVSPFGTVYPRVQLETTYPDFVTGPVRMSKSNGHWSYGDQRWTVGWELTHWSHLRQVALSGQPTGTVAMDAGLDPTFSISPLLDGYGTARPFAVAAAIGSPGNELLLNVNTMDANGNLTFGVWGLDFAFLEQNGLSKLGCSVETDGSRFNVAYTELAASGAETNVFMATFAFDGVHGYTAQSHVPISNSPWLSEGQPRLASKHSSGSTSLDTLCVFKRFAGAVKKLSYTDAILATLFY